MFAPAAGFDVLGMSAAVTKPLHRSLKKVVREGLVEWALVRFADNLSGRCWPSPWLAEFDVEAHNLWSNADTAMATDNDMGFLVAFDAEG